MGMERTLRLEFAQWLREQLRSQGWMVSDFAERVGVRPSAVYRWTAGQRMPTDAQVERIADTLRLPGEVVWQALARAGASPTGPPRTRTGQPAHPTSPPAPPVAPRERPFAQWLRQQLEDRGWTTGFLARSMDLDPVTVRAWATGQRDPATVQIPSIARVLDADVAVVQRLIEG